MSTIQLPTDHFPLPLKRVIHAGIRTARKVGILRRHGGVRPALNTARAAAGVRLPRDLLLLDHLLLRLLLLSHLLIHRGPLSLLRGLLHGDTIRVRVRTRCVRLIRLRHVRVRWTDVVARGVGLATVAA